MADLTFALDAEQYAAATAPERLVRCRAGAGSGKTATLSARARWLVHERGVLAAKLLVITFSKRAADELRARVDPAIAAHATIVTIHALGFLIVRTELPGRRVADEGVRRKLVRKVMRDLGVEIKFAEVLAAIARHKGAGQPLPPWATGIHAAYEAQLHAAKMVDFDDLLLVPEAHLRERPEVRARWCGRWSHVLLDEAQDTSPIQWRLLRHLVADDTHLFIAGDFSQAIYSFRGTDPTLMLDGADEMFGTFADYPLSTNYRSRPLIVALANKVIGGRRAAVTLQPARGDCVACVRPVVHWLGNGRDRGHEAQRVVDELRAERADGLPWRDMLVLYRCNAQSEALEAACLKMQVPAIVAGGVGFYGRREVLDVLAYLKLAQEWDVEALDRVYNRPSRYLGEAFYQELQRGGGWPAVIEGRIPTFSKSYMSRRLGDFLRDVRALQREYEDGTRVAALVAHVLEAVGPEGYKGWLLGEEPGLEDEVRGENLDALLEAARGHATVADLLAFAARCERRNQRAADGGDGYVTLSTIHRMKGCEAPLVVLAGLTEGVLPHVMALREDPAAEEELRLLYVAVTRARDRLILSSWGARSPFWTATGGPGTGDEDPQTWDDDDNEEDGDDDIELPSDAELAEWDRGLGDVEEGSDADDATAEAGAGGPGERVESGAAADAAGDAARGGGEPLVGGARDRGADVRQRPARRGDSGDGE